jgi:hypothetical protein
VCDLWEWDWNWREGPQGDRIERARQPDGGQRQRTIISNCVRCAKRGTRRNAAWLNQAATGGSQFDSKPNGETVNERESGAMRRNRYRLLLDESIAGPEPFSIAIAGIHEFDVMADHAHHTEI